MEHYDDFIEDYKVIDYLSDIDDDIIDHINNYFSNNPINKFNKIKVNNNEIQTVINYVICEDIKKLFQR